MAAHWIFILSTCFLSGLLLSVQSQSRLVQQNDILSTDIPQLVTVQQVPRTSLVPDTWVDYVMESDHSKVHLILRPNRVLISPAFSVDVKRTAGEHQVGWNPSTDDTKRFMYLHGHVGTDASSMVAIQLQMEDRKMNGLIAFGGHSYWIEPTSEERYHLLIPLPVQTEHIERGGCSTKANSNQSSSNKSSQVEDTTDRSLLERRRRSATKTAQKFIETTVVVDQSMTDFHGIHTQQYVMSIMNMVHRLFRDPSIGHTIDIVITQLIILNSTKPMNLTGEANKDINNFCLWMQEIKSKKNSQSDLSILLTRKDQCVPNHQKCQESWGVAFVKGACEQFNCALIRDRGFQSAYSIAHEIGHSLGMQHDDQANSECAHSSKQSFLMLSHWTKQPKRHMRWSTCSKQSLTEFLQSAKCLDNNPHQTIPLLLNYPGQNFQADNQCQFNHGKGSQTCPTKKDVCRELWCQDKSTNGSCYTTGLPAADGTVCGYKKVCWIGRCVKQHNIPAPVDGSWGEWTAHSGCSRTCGGGVAISKRRCEQPKPSRGGRDCVGQRMRYSLCNIQTCPPGSVNFRELQCAQRNNIPYKNSLKEWLPETISGRRCQLICRAKGQYLVTLLESKAVDGTRCKGNGVCIDGQCHTVGCDNKIDSKVELDRCGVCGGDNTTCNSYSFLYNKQHVFGYEKACHFPVGAQEITVIEKEPSINFLALKTSSRFVINGNWKLMAPRTVHVAGTRMKYSRQGRLESFTATGPISEELFVYVIFQGTNSGVLCEFVISTEIHFDNKLPTHRTNGNSSGTWVYSSWSDCSKTCGKGVKRRTAKCIKYSHMVIPSYCEDRPLTEMKCHHTQQCPQWKTHRWTDCSAMCGQGVQTRRVVCQHSSTHGHCPFETKPITSKPCFKILCGNWTTGNWSKCSTSCGQGIRRRDVSCVSPQSGDLTSSSLCDMNMKPPDSQHCQVSMCPHQTSTPSAGSNCKDYGGDLCQAVAAKPESALQSKRPIAA